MRMLQLKFNKIRIRMDNGNSSEISCKSKSQMKLKSFFNFDRHVQSNIYLFLSPKSYNVLGIFQISNKTKAT